MIKLNLELTPPRPVEVVAQDASALSLDTIERDLHRAFTDLSQLIDRRRQATVYLPSDVLMQAWPALMPPERMGVIAARQIDRHFVLSGMYDVTGCASPTHVQADPSKLGYALLNFERAGMAFAAWIHSHPGQGPGATTPSRTDRVQYADWTRDFNAGLLGVIVVKDGCVRLWGDAVESGVVRVEIIGAGLRALPGHPHVYKLDI